ncbi:MAG: dienelactone hydrolase family protein [Bacteroidota bacterium]|nr:dienelactone hydrolase family protein [Bacteroidota bacterium]
MKKNLFITAALSLLFLSGSLQAQTKTCCKSTSTGEFAMLGSDVAFQSAHLAPVPFNFVPIKGEAVTFPVADGKEGHAYLVKATEKSDQYLFVFHEWWGLNDHIRQEAEKFAEDFPGVNIMAIDLYDGQIATNAEDAGKIMQSIQQERAEAIINGAINYAGRSASFKTIGWCFGGAWSLQAAIIMGSRAKGCVMYYGMPEKNPEKLKLIQAPVLGIFATRDSWITKPVVEAFEAQMKEMKKPVTITWFEADHAFANPSNPKFDEAATAKARMMSVAFLKSK